MVKKLVCALLAGVAAMPVLATEVQLRLPANARVDVQVVDSVVLDQHTPSKSDVLLRPVEREQSSATHRLPPYCLITAAARLEDQHVRLTTQSVTCIEAEGDRRTIFTGELPAAAFERDGGFGLNVCTRQQEGECVQAVLEPAHHFQLNVSQDSELDALANPSAEINQRRRQASDDDATNLSAE